MDLITTSEQVMKATRQKIMVIRIHKSSDRNELIVNMSRTLSCCRNETESKRVRVTTEFFFFKTERHIEINIY